MAAVSLLLFSWLSSVSPSTAVPLCSLSQSQLSATASTEFSEVTLSAAQTFRPGQARVPPASGVLSVHRALEIPSQTHRRTGLRALDSSAPRSSPPSPGFSPQMSRPDRLSVRGPDQIPTLPCADQVASASYLCSLCLTFLFCKMVFVNNTCFTNWLNELNM